ncbi:phage tail protein [Serratia plymuthica]|uniref:phage tail protein n=1 Tax=Serratia plymuthica TaxID=82996 RepID=UPI0004565673|nr:phage tail protein [Serratia plymuthica]AHY05782.1 phage tail protein [Serratia plymuthica]
MTAKYRALLTDQGKALLANAAATGQKLEITQMAVGDGGGTATIPSESQTKLVGEKRRAALNSLQVDTNSNNQVTAEQVIPEDAGGWWIRELGLYDKNGVLVAIANTPDTYKPLLAEGAGRTQVVRMVLLVKGDASAMIVADKTAVLVSRDTLDAAIAEHARSRNHPDATLLAKGFIQLSNDSNSNSESLAATPKAVKTVNDASLKITANLKDVADKGAARSNLGLGSAATRNVGTEAANLMEVGAFGLGSGSMHRADAYGNRGEIYRVNGTSKNSPGSGTYGVINLPCDGGPSSGYLAIQNSAAAYIGSSSTPEKPLSWYRIYTTAYKPTAADVGALTDNDAEKKYALRTTKINGKTLTGDISLSATDINSWSKTESDTRYLMVAGGTLQGIVKTSSDIQSLNIDNFRIASANYGTFWRNDDLNFYLMLTNKGDKFGGYNNLRPLYVNLMSGNVNMGHALWVEKNVSSRAHIALTKEATPEGSGSFSAQLDTAAPFHQQRFDWTVNTGGLYVPIVKGVSNRKDIGYPTAVSFGYLLKPDNGFAHPVIHVLGDNNFDCIWDFDPNTGLIASKAGTFCTQQDAQNRANTAQNNAQNWAYQNLVNRVQRGAQSSLNMDGNLVEAPGGCFLTGGNGNEGNQVGVALYRPIQIMRNGIWATIEG